MRRYLSTSLLALPAIWDLLTKIAARATTELENLFRDLPKFQVDDNATDTAMQTMSNLFLIHTTCVYVAISIYDILEDAVTKTGGSEWFMPCFEALGKAQAALKDIARHIEVIRLASN